MKIEQAHIDQIRTAFQNMQSREDLLQLLNDVKPLVYGDKAIPFELKQLTWYSNPKLAKKRYTEFKVKKKSGAERTIHAPIKGLKSIQKVLSFILQCVYEPHHAAMGFVRDKSIVDNAKVHVGSKYVYNIDLKDFFTSIDQARIWKCLQLRPFNLINLKEIDDVKVDQNATITPLTHRGNTGIVLDEEIVFKWLYKGYNYPNGKFKIRLIDGGFIYYEIETHLHKNYSGTITIFNTKSSYEMIKELAIKFATENNSDADLELKLIINKLIEVHQRKRQHRETRLRLANIIASLCCAEMEVERRNTSNQWQTETRNVLPQGAPTSPVLANIVCQRMDYLLSAVAKRFGLKYTRYADDITFSSMHNVYQSDSDFLIELQRIITDQGFQIKESKTRLQKEGFRQEVTGLLVNENVNVQKRYIKQLRMWLYYWETYGVTRAENYFHKQYIADKGNIIKGKPNMANVIEGKLNFLKMVKGDENELYLKLKGRFDKLTSKQSFISKVLQIWETNGIESAMKLYYSKNIEQPTNNSSSDSEFTPFDIDEFLDNQSI